MPRFLILYAHNYEDLRAERWVALEGAETETEVRRKLKSAKTQYRYARVVEFRDGIRRGHKDFTLYGI